MSISITLNEQKKHEVSPHLYGIFYEDINFSCDGGINANMVMNYSFEGVFLDRKTEQRIIDPLRGWSFTGKEISCETEDPLNENSRYVRLTADGEAELTNLGFNGDKSYADKGAMSIIPGNIYLFECWLRCRDFSGNILVDVLADDGSALTKIAAVALSEGGNWTKVCVKTEGIAEGYGRLRIRLCGNGSVDLDCVSFMNSDFWNSSDPKYKYGKFRKIPTCTVLVSGI